MSDPCIASQADSTATLSLHCSSSTCHTVPATRPGQLLPRYSHRNLKLRLGLLSAVLWYYPTSPCSMGNQMPDSLGHRKGLMERSGHSPQMCAGWNIGTDREGDFQNVKAPSLEPWGILGRYITSEACPSLHRGILGYHCTMESHSQTFLSLEQLCIIWLVEHWR